MSITDDARPESRPPSSGGPSSGGFDKSPPQDVAAEQSVLGGMLLSKDAIADVVEILKPHDFYRPVHTTVFDTILDLYGRGEPADGVTVAAALADSGDLQRVGGVPYLHTLIESVPTAANASYYARIVSERAVLRRLVEAGTKIVQLGYGTGGNGGRDVDDIVDLAQQAVYDVTERRVSEDFAILADMLQPTLDEIEAVGATGGMMTGVPTGFSDLDRLLNGLHPGQLVIVAGRPGLGKALAVDTPIPTPTGWTTMGAVRPGDVVLGDDGRPTTVVHAFEVMDGRPCYEVEFSDGSTVVADADHLWRTTARASRRRVRDYAHAQAPGVTREPDGLGWTSGRETTAEHDGVRTTEEIAETLTHPADGSPNHAVANAAPLQLPEAEDLPVAPYALGARLGDGHSTADGYSDEHIPMAYLRASIAQRRAVLAGLMDTGGTVTGTGSLQLPVTSKRLAEDAYELIVSLGYRCSMSPKGGHGRVASSSVACILTFSTTDRVFRVERKHVTHQRRCRTTDRTGTGSRHITAVRPVASVPVRCITVSNDSHLYLAGRSMIPTHNSTVSMDFARNAAIRANCASAIFSLEMSKIEIVMRLLSAEARVPLHVLRSGQLSDDDWTKLARRMGEISEAPIFVDDTPSMNLMEIRAKARRLKQRHDLKLIVVDYLQLMTSPKRTESRQQEVADLSRGLKLLAKEVECPVIAVSQLNRGPEQRTDKRPQLSDLRESGCLTADTRIVRADDNSEVTLGELLASGTTAIPVWALNDRLQYTARTMTHVFSSGHRPVFRLTLTSGRHVDATANHPFLTYDGWKPLDQLTVGDRLAAPRHLPPPLIRKPWVEDELVLLAHLLGGGSFVRRQPIRYASRDEANLEAVSKAAKHFGITAVRDDSAPAEVTSLRFPAPLACDRRDPIAGWLDELGLFGLNPNETFLPERLHSLPKDQVKLFLSHLWAAGGSVTVNESGTGGRICFSASSRSLLDGIARLLLRFGITVRVETATGREPRPQFTLEVPDRDDQLRFVREVGVTGGWSAHGNALRGVLERTKTDSSAHAVPAEVWADVRSVLADDRELAVATGRAVSSSAARDYGPVREYGPIREPGPIPEHGPSRHRLAQIAAVLNSADLELHATNDVFFDEIATIEYLGEQDVFDATVAGQHNFIANGIATHNSIEQDADVVILLHRDDYYDKESPRAGEADFIVAKHRNGPTDTVTVAAQLHLARFVDMAIG